MNARHDQDLSTLSDCPDAFWKRFVVTKDDLDGFNHVNNAVYLKWLDATVWEHTRAVGLGERACLELDRGMAAARHEIDYIASAFLGDEIVVYNWISANDQRLRASRSFQVIRLQDMKTILRAKSHYVCTKLSTGRPTRMPEIFKTAYDVKVSVQR
ncbi:MULTISPECIES: thioesterase family protein [unclassified Ruegeria]|uniref:acyl-CoA thioesterase n=1 Tax=unclassified Ruegeria TaxID=2625375 RepID=UPI00147B1E57|nr:MULTISPECIES: thioesterase family protein [unclassified Ruegeria]MBO9413626.1 acyl-CoA thioesterase [Ruegeria sp. R8_1]MBO9417612.1 acyl-CoA thioesterase [Ruegeria sp. R8_2]